MIDRQKPSTLPWCASEGSVVHAISGAASCASHGGSGGARGTRCVLSPVMMRRDAPAQFGMAGEAHAPRTEGVSWQLDAEAPKNHFGGRGGAAAGRIAQPPASRRGGGCARGGHVGSARHEGPRRPAARRKAQHFRHDENAAVGGVPARRRVGRATLGFPARDMLCGRGRIPWGQKGAAIPSPGGAPGRED